MAERVLVETEWLATQLSVKIALLVYGSPPDRATTRSDVDILFWTEDTLPENEAEALKAVVDAAATELRVIIDAHTITAREVRATEGSIAGNPFLVEHLRLAAATSPYRLGNPIAGLKAIDDYPPERRLAVALDVTLGYLRRKADGLDGALRQGEEAPLIRLQRGVELPKSVGLKLLRLMRVAQDAPANVESLASAASVEGQLLALDLPDRRWRAVGRLIGLNREYSDLLDATVAGAVSLKEYAGWISAHRQTILEQAWKLTQAVRWYVIHEIMPTDK